MGFYYRLKNTTTTKGNPRSPTPRSVVEYPLRLGQHADKLDAVHLPQDIQDSIDGVLQHDLFAKTADIGTGMIFGPPCLNRPEYAELRENINVQAIIDAMEKNLERPNQKRICIEEIISLAGIEESRWWHIAVQACAHWAQYGLVGIVSVHRGQYGTNPHMHIITIPKKIFFNRSRLERCEFVSFNEHERMDSSDFERRVNNQIKKYSPQNLGGFAEQDFNDIEQSYKKEINTGLRRFAPPDVLNDAATYSAHFRAQLGVALAQDFDQHHRDIHGARIDQELSRINNTFQRALNMKLVQKTTVLEDRFKEIYRLTQGREYEESRLPKLLISKSRSLS